MKTVTITVNDVFIKKTSQLLLCMSYSRLENIVSSCCNCVYVMKEIGLNIFFMLYE